MIKCCNGFLKTIILIRKKFDLLFHLLIGLDILIGSISVVSFVLYVLARGKENEGSEKRYQNIHFISLFIFVVIGVIILIMLSDMNL